MPELNPLSRTTTTPGVSGVDTARPVAATRLTTPADAPQAPVPSSGGGNAMTAGGTGNTLDVRLAGIAATDPALVPAIVDGVFGEVYGRAPAATERDAYAKEIKQRLGQGGETVAQVTDWLRSELAQSLEGWIVWSYRTFLGRDGLDGRDPIDDSGRKWYKSEAEKMDRGGKSTNEIRVWLAESMLKSAEYPKAAATLDARSVAAQSPGKVFGGTANLCFGQKGPAVIELKQRLAHLDFDVGDVKSDLFDRELFYAMQALQRKSGVIALGELGPTTLNKLVALERNSRTGYDLLLKVVAAQGEISAKTMPRGAVCASIDLLLNDCGETVGSDAVYDANTETAVKSFQKKNGLAETGAVDKATLDKLIAVSKARANKLVKLDVKYRSQLDNDSSIFGDGSRQCNTTSNTMLADFLLKGELSRKATAQGYPEPESVYMRLVAPYGDTTNHDAQTKALRDLGIESYFSHTLSKEDVLSSLAAGIPVVCGFAYKGDGHICIIVGHDPQKKVFLVHDPYGTRNGTSDSYQIGVGGAYDEYSYAAMNAVYWDGGPSAGWGRIVTKIKGQATGMPNGL
jgi:peptidoglycan hydrolase-like protein with peptidoglycan-binding domain